MEVVLEILKYILPAAIVFITAWMLLKAFLENEHKRRLLEMKMERQGMISPVRLQAYERIVLLLERISPGSILMRVASPGMSAFQLQTTLIQTIREEFEHNLSQQIYVSSSAWELTRSAKEETIKLVNLAASRLNDGAGATELSTLILEMSMNQDRSASATAIEFIKNEVRTNF